MKVKDTIIDLQYEPIFPLGIGLLRGDFDESKGTPFEMKIRALNRCFQWGFAFILEPLFEITSKFIKDKNLRRKRRINED